MTRAQSVAIAFLALALPPVFGQSARDVQRTLTAELQGKQMLIRDFLGERTLRYSWQGDHLDHTPERVFQFGVFELDTVKAHESGGKVDRVTLTGMRGTVLKWDLAAADALSASAQPVTLEVDLHGADAATVAKLASLLFYADMDEALRSVPPQWVMALGLRKPGVNMSGGWRGKWVELDGKWVLATGNLTSPRLVYAAEPEFSEEARRLKKGGNVLVAVEFDARGEVEAVWIKRPLGLGLDEKAAQVTSKYKFQPWQMDGVPVGGILTVDVNFQIF